MLHYLILAKVLRGDIRPWSFAQDALPSSSRVASPRIGVGSRAKPISGVDTEGKPVGMVKDYKGKLVLVVFWASNSQTSITELARAKRALEADGQKGFDVLAVSVDRTGALDAARHSVAASRPGWREIVDRQGLDSPVARAYGVRKAPDEFLIDGDTGYVLGVGVELSSPNLSEIVARKIAENKARHFTPNGTTGN